MTPSVASLQRHPLKSHGREALAAVTLTRGQGIAWDRHWAVAHEAARIVEGEWAPCQNFSRGSKAPALMAIEARLDEARAELTLSHPARPDLTFRPDAAEDLGRFLDWVRPLCPADRAQPVRIHSVPGRGMTDTDYPSVSIISLASNRALGEHLGVDLSPLRWRANIWLEGLAPWQERGWVGRRLRIGTAVLEIVEPKVRCLATTANPRTGQRDADTLRALRALHGDQDFGLYARVLEGGTVELGDGAELVP
ncbi:MOSC domain-containing protein [Albidovulum sp.]